jgi:hypothetical protein
MRLTCRTIRLLHRAFLVQGTRRSIVATHDDRHLEDGHLRSGASPMKHTAIMMVRGTTSG